MRSSTKHGEREFSISVPLLSGGLNLSVPPHAIGMNQIADGWNVWLTPTGDFASRPGALKVNTTSFPAAVAGGFYSAPLDKTIVATYGQELYLLDEGTGTATKIGDLTGSQKPDFADFMGKCFIASGGMLQVYDGTTLSSVTSLTSNPAPSHAIFLEAFENRLWVAETGSKLNFCGTRDYQDWGGSVSDSGGFIYVEDGDGAQITGLGILDGIPVVFKGNWDRGPYSISKVTGMSVDDFTAKIMTKGTSCVSGHTVKNFLNDLLFVGQEGVFSHQQVRDYENPRAFPVSKSVDSVFKAYTAQDAVYDPVTGYYIVVTSLPVMLMNGSTGGWFQWIFPTFTPRSVFLGKFNDILFGTSDGDVQKVRPASAAYTDNGTAFQASFSTAVINGGSPGTEKKWKWLHMAFKPMSPGNFSVEWRTNFAYNYLGARAEVVPGDIFTEWDGTFCWDDSTIGWDQDTFIARRGNLQSRGRDIQFRVISTGGFRLISMNANGAVLRKTIDPWR